MQPPSPQAGFEQIVLPHLDAAHNLARWLTGDEDDAEDVVQEAFLRAFKAFGGYRGGNGRTWLLAIVRNTCYTWLRENRRREMATGADEQMEAVASDAVGPEGTLLRKADAQMLRQAVQSLPHEYREVIVLRELEDLSYKEMADICAVPIGTIMSRLARARQQLQRRLLPQVQEGVP